ncbi:hypothetical protein [Epilithonimonas tenax]|uniref:hypothetical protein n=1 Tax=Epilithonimonas tenax TaxID=191577 RepID=UPI0004840361|nr:hypothetical protein [Epilithonimonas tenax]
MDIEEYFDESNYLNEDKTLKEKCFILYHSHPNWQEIPRDQTLIIYQDFSFEKKLFWYKFPLKKRLFSSYKSNLIPENIFEILRELNALETLKIKNFYTSKTEKYSPEGLSEDSYQINHNGKNHSINMSSYWTDETLFISNEEKCFLKLHKSLFEWKNELYESIIKLHI